MRIKPKYAVHILLCFASDPLPFLVAIQYIERDAKPMSIPLGLWLKLFRKFAKIFAAQGAPPMLTPVANKKSSIRKVFIILFEHEHLWVVELTFGQFFSFKFTLRCKQSNIVPIIFRKNLK